MAPLKAGDKFPDDVKFSWSPISGNDPTVCAFPQEYNASKEWKDKRVVLVSVPGAFTPGCQGNHLPPYVKNIDKLREKGADILAVIAFNDSFVMSAWGKVNDVSRDDFLFLSDTSTFFSKKYGWDAGVGDRNGRWAMIKEKDGTISYAENEKSPREVTVSGAESVLEAL